MIRSQAAGGLIVQLRLELAESPAPAVALWELVGEQQRQAAMALLAALIAQTVAAEGEAGNERVPLGGPALCGSGDDTVGRQWPAGAAGEDRAAA
jgi:hypothetical protein